MSHACDEAALRLIQETDPIFSRLVRAGEAISIPEGTVLHAGPHFRHGCISAPVLHSAMVAAVFEGWAASFDQAKKQIECGEIRLAPAQDFNVVVPLASVASPGMWLQEVRASTGDEVAAYSPLNGGSGPAMRLGRCTAETLEHVRWLNGTLAESLEAAFTMPIRLIPIAEAGMLKGDDCHGRTQASSNALLRILVGAGASFSPDVLRFLEGAPSFFLNLWMAACKAMALKGTVPGSAVISAIGGNGCEFGVQLGGAHGHWVTASSAPPQGAIDAAFAGLEPLPAIGDSAIVDGFGFGCLAMHHSAPQLEALARYMPGESQALGEAILMGPHPGFSRLDVRVACSARKVVGGAHCLPIALGILDRAGQAGRIGGGIALAPQSALQEALERVSQFAPSPPSAHFSSSQRELESIQRNTPGFPK